MEKQIQIGIGNMDLAPDSRSRMEPKKDDDHNISAFKDIGKMLKYGPFFCLPELLDPNSYPHAFKLLDPDPRAFKELDPYCIFTKKNN